MAGSKSKSPRKSVSRKSKSPRKSVSRKSSNAMVDKLKAQVAKLKEECKELKAECKQLKADLKKGGSKKKSRKPRPPSEYNKFVKKHMQDEELQGLPSVAEKMKAIAQMWRNRD
jgi:hypothetical protein